MKPINLLLTPLLMAACSIAAANNSLPKKQVNIPFNNEAIISTDHSGLAFNYDMNGSPSKKLVCKLSNIYKSWLEFRDQGALKESGTYGEYQTVTFTSKGQDDNHGESHSIYHTDTVGDIKINETPRVKPSIATASCFYVVENSTK